MKALTSSRLHAALVAIALAASSVSACGKMMAPAASRTSGVETSSTNCRFPRDLLREIRSRSYFEPRTGNSKINAEMFDEAMTASAPLRKLLRAQLDVPEKLRSGNTFAAICANKRLAYWAEGRALLGHNSQRGFNERMFYLSGVGLVYLRNQRLLADAGYEIPAAERAIIARWFSETANSIIDAYAHDPNKNPRYRYFSPPEEQRAGNLGAWAALTVAVAGEISGEDRYFAWAARRAEAVLGSVNDGGVFPVELKRRGIALHKHFFAINPLAGTQAILTRNGHVFTRDSQIKFQKLIRFSLGQERDPKAISGMTRHRVYRLAENGDRREFFVGVILWCSVNKKPIEECEKLPSLAGLSFPYMGGDPAYIWNLR